MVRYAWTIFNKTTSVDYTSSVLSFTFNAGRQAYLDSYNACALTLTIKNQANESAGFTYGDQIYLKSPTGSQLYAFYVTEVAYSDYPGNIGLSTATIICQDGLGLMGRLQMNAYPITAGASSDQFIQLDSVPGKLANRPQLISNIGFGSQCSAANYSGSVLNFINLLVNTERAVLTSTEAGNEFVSRDKLKDSATSNQNFDRTPSATMIGYQDFERINLGLDLVNQAQTQPAGLAVQQATNAASVATFGAQGITVSTVDANTTQALGLAEWIANSLSDTTKQRFVVTFIDVAQTMTTANFTTFVFNLARKQKTTITYRVPGDAADTTAKILIEGFTASATPSQTTFTAYLTPLTYYQFFTLNDTILGVLDTSRLGW